MVFNYMFRFMVFNYRFGLWCLIIGLVYGV
jgi:hypothetical protein